MEDYMEGDILTTATSTVAERLLDAVNRHDVDAIMDAMTADCVVEAAQPSPNGARFAGKEAVRRYWEALLRSREFRIEIEEEFAAGDSCAVRHQSRWIEEDGTPGHVRGATLIRVRSGHVAEMRVYVKA